ncbi:N-6 DNA methylase [Emcibacteraceae bacterium]|jgi:tRNA1(Val) A37 N6-methylase TrmN6|nr:N-6 DNA methylase [Emcibacteraceae bacterium]
MTNIETTCDDFLGGRINLNQPAKGYRVTSDSVFLAATINPQNNQRVLDMGAGSGAILCCLWERIKDKSTNVTLHGVEMQKDLMDLAIKNASQFSNNIIKYFEGDIFANDIELEPNSYHHVISNPPYYDKGSVTTSPYQTKALAHGKAMDDLKVWIERSVRMLRPKGYITLVHRADRLDDILTALNDKCGSVIVYPLYSKQGDNANRVIIRAQKGAKGLLSLKSGLIVHKSDGEYSDEAENILRHAHGLYITK